MLMQLQSRVSKPILFAVYGAVGGLLGALVLGEPAWAFLKPAPAVPPRPTTQVSTSPFVILEQGSRNSFEVAIVRERFEGPVRVATRGAATGVTLTEATIAAADNTTSIEVEASASAAVSKQDITIAVTSPENPSVLESTATMTIEVRPYVPPPPPQVDVVFVLDVTGSMEFAINGVRDGIVQFVDNLARQELDIRIGMVAFRDISMREPPEVLKFPEAPFTNQPEAFRTQVQKLVASGGGDEPESSPNALSLASTLPFREGATRVVVFITDAPPLIPDGEISDVAAVHPMLVKGGVHQVHLIVPERLRRTYAPLQSEPLTGKFFDLGSVVDDPKAFIDLLPKVSGEIARITIASQPARPPQASAPPSPPIQALNSSVRFEAGSTNRLTAAISVWTAMASIGICWVLVAGQSLYLRQALPGVSAGIKAAAGGLVAGLLGGIAGQLLFHSTSELWETDIPSRLAGWMVFGTLAGGGLSFFVPNLKVSRALLGGLFGGLGGALGYLLVESVVSTLFQNDAPARLLGASTVGLCIGLMVALAERISRRAWLEVKYGPNETRLVNLGAEPVVVGGESRRSTIWIRGAADIVGSYLFQQGQVQFATPAGQRSELPDGHVARYGAVEIVVHTANAAQTGIAATPGTGVPANVGPKPPPPPLRRPVGNPVSGAPAGQASPAPAASPLPVPPLPHRPHSSGPTPVAPPPPMAARSPSNPIPASERSTFSTAGKAPPPPPPPPPPRRSK
jgi:Mg-chelatase subunit ChlD